MFRSFSNTLPVVGCTRRLMQRISVDLPAPDGPIRPRTSPLGNVERHIAQGFVSRFVGLAQTIDFQHLAPFPNVKTTGRG